MPDSAIVLLIQQQQLALSKREAGQMRLMTKRWLELEHALEAEMLRTTTVLGSEAAVTEAMILRNEHFKRLLYQARAEYAKYADYLEKEATSLQTKGLSYGVSDAYKVLQVSLKEIGEVIAFDKINVSAINTMIGFSADGSPLRNLLMKSYGDAVNGILSELLSGLGKGLNPIKVAENMANGFGIGLQRALTIARTEQLRAYRMGSFEQYRTSGVVTGYKRLAKKDGKTCLGCLFSDGELITNLDGEFDEHPNGRCTSVPIVRGASIPQWETGVDWFAKQSESTQQEMLGPQRYAAWKNGTDLKEMTKLVNDTTWGGSFVPTPISEITGGG